MMALPLMCAALPHIDALFPPVPLDQQVKNIPTVLLAVLLYGTGAAYLALWRAAPEYRVFRILGAFSITVGTVQTLAYFGEAVPSLSVRAIATALMVETAGEAIQVPNRRWTRLFWPIYLFAVIAAWIPSILFVTDWPIMIAAIPLGILIVQGFYRGNARDRMVATAFSVYFVVRLTLSDSFQKLTGISGAVTIGAWRLPIAISTHFLLVAVTLVIFARDLINDRREKQRMAAELAASKAVQQVLIPRAVPSISGFNVQSVYRPFGDVGGDFFQIVPLARASALVVIGDVSGKEVPAAMTVSLVVGALSLAAESTVQPGEILAALNRVLCGRHHDGFTTCMVVRADADGTLIASNAGHIAPYLDGKELQLENGLPLGLSAESDYPETQLTLAPGAMLTFMSDGVVEARSPTGELFGFERTAAISTQSAEDMAAAAQAFGQEDDITVLTLRFSPAEVIRA